MILSAPVGLIGMTSRTSEVRRARLDRWRIVYLIDEETRILSILAVRKRPPYNYQDLAELLRSLK